MPESRPLSTILSAALLFAALLCGLAATSCSDSHRPRTVLEVVSTNDNSTLQSDVLREDDGSATVIEDEVEIRIKSNPHDRTLDLTANGPFGYVTLERYEIRFQSSEQIPGVNGTLGWTVHTGETISGRLVVVPGGLKVVPPLVSLVRGGEILATARIKLYGRETDSDYPVTVETTLPVNFANWQDD